MTRNKRSGKTHIRTLIVLVLVLTFAVIIAVGVYQNQPGPKQPKKPATEYFEIIDPGLEDYRLAPDNKSVIMYRITFRLKAVGGDAHDVAITSRGGTDPFGIVLIRANQSEFVDLVFPASAGYRSLIDDDAKFPYTFNIASTEAEGPVTIKFALEVLT